MPPDGGEHPVTPGERHIAEMRRRGFDPYADYPPPDPDECLYPYEDELSLRLRDEIVHQLQAQGAEDVVL